MASTPDRPVSSEPDAPPALDAPPPSTSQRRNALPARDKRLGVESLLVRLVSTLGIIGIGVLLGAILVGQDVEGWIVGLVVSLVSVVLAAILWSSRRL